MNEAELLKAPAPKQILSDTLYVVNSILNNSIHSLHLIHNAYFIDNHKINVFFLTVFFAWNTLSYWVRNTVDINVLSIY